MDAQKQFLASTLQGAMDAEVINFEDLFKHLSAEVLAENVPAEVLWGCLLEGMHSSGIGPGDAPPPPPKAEAKEEADAEDAEEEPVEDLGEDDDEDDDDAPPDPGEGASGSRGGSIDIDVTDALDDLPPLPDDEELAVEDVDWEGEEK